MSQETTFTTVLGGDKITVGTGVLAEQAGGAITMRVGDCLLLATATMSRSVREGLDFFPLSADFEEKMYAAGRIPGNFFRREARPTTEAILISRLIDRPLRPLFPKGMRNEVQVIVTTFSADDEHHLDVLAVNAASTALHISDIPWNGPIGAVRVGYIDGEFVSNPTIQEMESSTLNLRMAASKEAIIMVEAGADEVPESLMVDALTFGHAAMQSIIALQEEMRAAIGKEKREPTIEAIDEDVVTAVQSRLGSQLRDTFVAHTDRYGRNEAVDALREEIVNGFIEEDETT
ncbi:MAG: polyribonucleotide nucleotidyltransferase, partial [Anaerolineales bacterium]|nr:polyribonucleotide nucleotidyltransferase [Anaerolineales bacterium]